MSTNTNDIPNINLNDTFYTWYTVSNQVIDFVNPLKVYDVIAGQGLSESRTGDPGTVEFTVVTNNGVDRIINSNGVYEVVLNFVDLTTATVTESDLFVVQDSDSNNTIKKITAENMLPPSLNGDHTFDGTITVNDLIVNDGNIILNNTGTTQDNTGIIIEGGITPVSFFYDLDTDAWFSSENLGLKSGKSFVSDAASGSAKFPFLATGSQGPVDISLEANISGFNEAFSIKGQWNSENTLQFAHYTNGTLQNNILQLKSTGTNGGEVIVNNTITITDILNSTPFSQTPTIETVPITDSSDGYLNNFVNRVKLPKGSVAVGDVVKMGSSTLEAAIATTINNAQVIGIVESIDGADAVVITSGTFDGIYSGLTTGSIYYLSTTSAGDVINVNPENTNGALDKPVFIATSSTSGILIPDFVNTGSVASTIVSGGGISDAFKTVFVQDTSESIVASGEDTITFIGGNNITLSVDTNGALRIDGVSDALPTPTSRSVLISQSTTPSFLSINSYSLLGRSLNGDIDNITVTPGTIVGRLDDTNDSDNAVRSLSQSEVLNLLGFSDNNYIRTLIFSDGATNTTFTAAPNDESINIRAGENITFEYDSVDDEIVISAAGGTNGGGGSGNLQQVYSVGVPTAVTTETATDISSLKLMGNTYFYFTTQETTAESGTARIEGFITNEFLKLQAGSTTRRHDAGDTLKFEGIGGNIYTAVSGTGTANIFSIGLQPNINISSIQYSKEATDPSGFVLGTLASGGLRNTFIFGEDSTRVPANDYNIKINPYANITDGVSRLDSTSATATVLYNTKCISVYADVSLSGSTYSYPFKFYKIIADKIEVDDIIITGTAIKDLAVLDNITGFEDTTTLDTNNGTSAVQFNNSSPNDGVLIKFNDTDDIANLSWLFHPSTVHLNISGSPSQRVGENSLIISERIFFAKSDNVDDISPSIGWFSDGTEATAGTLLINSIDSTTYLRLTNNIANSYLLIGYDADNTKINYNSGSYNVQLSIDRDIIFGDNTYHINTFTLKGQNKGYKFDVQSTAFSSSDVGKSLIISSVSSGTATISQGFTIKPYDASAVAGDPINTLYYITA